MAELTSQAKNELASAIALELSSVREQIPIRKAVLRDMITVFDQKLRDAEMDILANVATGVAAWLTSHQAIARQVMIEVQKKRKEIL